MTRAEASKLIYEIINSGIVPEEIEEGLTDLANTLCYGEFEGCEETSPYCDNCRHKSEVESCEE